MAPPSGYLASPNSSLIYQQTPQVVSTPIVQQQMVQQQIVQPSNYVQYVSPSAQPRIINSTTLSPARQITYRMRAPRQTLNPNRMPFRPNIPHSNGAVIRSSPISTNTIRPRLSTPIRGSVPVKQTSQVKKLPFYSLNL